MKKRQYIGKKRMAAAMAMCLFVAGFSAAGTRTQAAVPEMKSAKFTLRTGAERIYKATEQTLKTYRISAVKSGNQKVAKVKLLASKKGIKVRGIGVGSTRIRVTFQHRTTKKTAAKRYVCKVLQKAGAADSSENGFERAQDAVVNMKVGTNFGNSLDSNGAWIAQWTDGKPIRYETAWGEAEITETYIKALKKLGYGAVRVPVTWAQHLDDKGNIDAAWMKRVQEVVDFVIGQDMYCILNVHHDVAAGEVVWIRASESNYQTNKAKFAKLWKQIAKQFSDYSDKLLFEGFNEMLDENNNWGSPDRAATDAVNKYNQLFVDTVRASGGSNANRNLIVSTYACQNTGNAVTAFVLPSDSAEAHLIVQVHSYNPAGLAENEAWAHPTDKFTESGKKEVDAVFASLKTNFTDKGIPVLIGECGIRHKNNTDERVKWAKYFYSAAKKLNIPCFYWDVGTVENGDFVLTDRKDGTVYFPQIVQAIMDAVG